MAHMRAIDGDEVRMSSGDLLYFSRSCKKDGLAAVARFLGGSA